MGRTLRWPASVVPRHRQVRQERTELRGDEVEDTWDVTLSSVGTAAGGWREAWQEGPPAGLLGAPALREPGLPPRERTCFCCPAVRLRASRLSMTRPARGGDCRAGQAGGPVGFRGAWEP